MERSPTAQLFAISAVDGRYRPKLELMAAHVSEAGLMRYRIRIEAEWLLHLAETPGCRNDLKLSLPVRETLEHLATQVPDSALLRIKELEQTTRHDLKAVEYYLREALEDVGADARTLAFLHFACTSEDINNLAYALMLHHIRHHILVPEVDRLLQKLEELAHKHRDLPMLSRTHGQAASPTTLGKEMAVFAFRLRKQRHKLIELRLEGKMSGAVGNYNAHLAAYPQLDWIAIARTFIEDRLGLKQNLLTTQIENHDTMVELCGIVRAINTILIGLARDMWSYIAIDYFKQEVKDGEVGSSTMPHKVNPIDFGNAEGNLGLANALAEHFAAKLPISRWQRDLSDSTVQRNLGTFFAHSVLAYQSLLQGFHKVSPHYERIALDLASAYEVLGEAIQTAMRRYGVVDAYERLKLASRGQSFGPDELSALIEGCVELPLAEKARLRALLPEAYTGCASQLVDLYLQER